MSIPLVAKYNVPGPRYTSYPTVPYWDHEHFSLKAWKETFKRSFLASNKREGISLYIHLPFCESMCTFCGCTKRITKKSQCRNTLYRCGVKRARTVQKLCRGATCTTTSASRWGHPHLFFQNRTLPGSSTASLKHADKAPKCEMSFEGHPNNTTLEHLETLASFGFKRVCYGVQDYNETVQKAINRMQPFEHVQRATDQARQAGYTSVGHDIIFRFAFSNAGTRKNIR